MSPREIADPFWGATRYVSDPNGQVLSADHGQNIGTSPTFPLGPENERFTYAPTLDITASGATMLAWTATNGGRVTAARGPQGERIRSTYDAAGRVTERRVERDGFRPQVWRFTWDGFDRMIGVVCPDGAAWSYIYDAFGRRTEKRHLRRGDSYPTSMTRYLWDGNVIAAEIPESDMGRAVWWHYDPEGFTPLLREEAGQFLHVIADHLGTPRELVDESGQVVWSITHRLWGGARGIWTAAAGGNAAPDLSVDWAPPAGTDPRNLCPIRFQGQWEDPETGLHYNRFRIYDPASAQYLSPDPVGLIGGLRAAGYVEVPTYFVDPLGLNRYPAWMEPRRGFERHHIIPWHMQNDPFLRGLGFDVNGRENMMYLPRRACSVSPGGTVGQRGSAQHRGFNGDDTYNRYMSDRLNQVKQRTRGQSRRCQQMAVRKLQLETRTMLGTGAMRIANCQGG